MRKYTFFVLGILCLLANEAWSSLSLTQTSLGVVVNGSPAVYSGGFNADGSPLLNSNFLGRLNHSSTLLLDGASLRASVGAPSQLCSGNMYYRIYLQGTIPGAFNTIGLSTFTNVSATEKKWSLSGAGINGLNGLTIPGVYYIEVYWTATGNATNSSCTTTFTDNNGGSYYTGSFEFSNTDSFTDGNFTSSPTWSGDTGNFTIQGSSDVTTAGAPNSNTIRLNAPNVTGVDYMSSPQANWNQAQTWSFWIGRRSQFYTGGNNVSIWLYANAANLEAATIDGYRLFIGDNGGTDELRLQVVTNNNPTTIILSNSGIANNTSDCGVTIKVTRSSSGQWNLYTSALPTSNGSGANAKVSPVTASTLFQGSATNTAYVPAGPGYYGFVVNHSNSPNACTAFEFDNFSISYAPLLNCPADQIVNLTSTCTYVVPDYSTLVSTTNSCNCSNPITFTQSPVAGTILTGSGITPVTMNATDVLGNVSTCSFNITRIDSTPPDISCPANVTVNATAGLCGALVNYSLPTYTDQCGTSCAPASIAGYTPLGTFNGHTYFRSNASTTWAAANTAATALGAHLVTISSLAEQNIFNGIGVHWMGFTDQVTEGDWKWVTNEPVTYTNWNGGEPNNSGNEDFAAMNWSGNAWNDWSGTSSAPFIVEFDCLQLTSGLYSGSLFPIGTTTVSYSAFDASGNSASCSFTVTVTDNVAPTIVCPANISAGVTPGQCSAVVNYTTPYATDNCGNCTTGAAIAGYTYLGSYNGSAYYVSNANFAYATAVSAANSLGGILTSISSDGENNFIRNSATTLGVGTYLIGLSDATTEGIFLWANGEPVVYTHWGGGEPNNSGNEDYTVVNTNGFWNDVNSSTRFVLEIQCIPVVRTVGQASGSAFPVGITTVTHQATDNNGNMSSCSFTVTIIENIAPVITCPATQNLMLNSTCSAVLPDYRSLVIVSDNCTPTASLVITQAPLPGTIVNSPGALSIVLSVTDGAGNSNTCSFNVSKVSTSPPQITCPSNITANIALGSCSAIVNYSTPTATDICSTCITPAAIAGFAFLGTLNGTHYYVSSAAASYATAIASSSASGGYLASINSAAENTFVRSAATTAGVGTYLIGYNDAITEGSFVWSNGDANGYTNWNAGEPNNLGNEDYTQVLASGFWNDIALGTSRYILELPCLTVSRISGLASGSLFPVGTSTVTYKATNANGLSVNCSFTITVVDNVAPTITCPGNQTIVLGAGCSVALPDYRSMAIKSDNCTTSGLLVVTQNPAPGSTITGAGITAITLTVTDASGNSTNCSFALNKIDNISPTVICPPTQTLVLGSACSAALPDYRNLATISDNCTSNASLSIAQSPPVGSTVSNTGTATITITAIDASGNAASCSFTVNKIDNTAPIVTCPSAQTILLGSTCSALLPDYRPMATKSDNCTASASIVLTQVPAAGTIINSPGATSVTITATDSKNNQSSCSFVVAAIDNIAPSITCPANQNIILDGAGNGLIPNYNPLVSATDNCTGSASIIISQNPAAGTIVSGSGSTLMTMTATDQSGNTQSCTFNALHLSITSIQFVDASATVNETAGTISIAVVLNNPSNILGTSATIVLNSGDPARVSGFTTQIVTYPAGTSGIKWVIIPITNNTNCDGMAQVSFGLTNPTGGNFAVLGSQNTFALLVEDDDTIHADLLLDDAEDGNISDWQQSNPGDWTASTSAPITGNCSIRHQVSGSAGSSWIRKDMDNQLLTGVNTTWQFNINHFGLEPSPDDNFMVYLASDQSDLSSGAVNGYGVGVKPANAVDPDYLQLWRIENGLAVAIIASTVFDWGVAHTKVGIEVVRDEAGLWTLRVDSNGGFDNLVSLGSGSDINISGIQYFGLKYNYTAATSGKLSIDDIYISHDACPEIWYSRANGVLSGSIWSHSPTGTGGQARFSQYSDFVLQNGNQVSADKEFVCKNLTIQSGTALFTDQKNNYIFGDFVVNGTLNQGSAPFIFKGKTVQHVLGTSPLSFVNVDIDNDGNTVYFNANNETTLKEVLSISEGFLETADRLILLSNTQGTASIGRIASGAGLMGKITLQRFIPQLTNYPYGSFVALGCPIQGQTVADWNDDVITTGFVGSDYPPPYPFTNIQYYNESVAGPMTSGYELVNALTNPLASDAGYFVYMQTASQIIDVTGNIYQQAFDRNIQFTNSGDPTGDGWNLLVNQYPSEVDFKKMADGGNGISSYWLYEAESANFRAYSATLNVGTAPRYIASSQSFFVKASAPGAYIHYDESFKTHKGISFERDEEEEETPHLSFVITAENGTSDYSTLAFSDAATVAFDQNYDALKIPSSNDEAVEFALMSADMQMLTIDARPMIDSSTDIPVYVEMPLAGSYYFKIAETIAIPEGWCVYVEDLLTGNSINASAYDSLLLQTTTPYSGFRLLIHTIKPVAVISNNATCFGSSNGSIEIVCAGNTTFSLTNAMGDVINSGNSNTIIENLSAGIYTLESNLNNNQCGAMEVNIEIQQQQPISSEVISILTAECNADANGEFSIAVQNSDSYEITVVSDEGEIIFSEIMSDPNFHLDHLTGQEYEVSINGGCGMMLHTVNLESNIETSILDVTTTSALCNASIPGSVELTTVYADDELSLTDENGQIIYSGFTNETINGLQGGYYLLSVQDGGSICPAIENWIFVENESSTQAEVTSFNIDECNLNSQGSITVEVTSSQGYHYTIERADHNYYQTGSADMNLLEFTELAGAEYLLTIDDGCGVISLTADLRDIYSANADIEDENITLFIAEGLTSLAETQAVSDPFSVYQWTFENEIQNGSVFSTEISAPGNYALVLEVSNGYCVDSDSIEVVVIEDLAIGLEPILSSGVFLWSESSDHITVTPTSAKSGLYRISVMDITGRLVFVRNVNAESGLWNIPIAQFSSGGYVLSIADQASVIYKRAFVRH
jgi:hypothetical protein